MSQKKTKEELESEVHATENALARCAADRWTTENMGGTWPKDKWQDMFNESSEADDDEWEAGMDQEWTEWFETAKRLTAKLVSLSLPLTLANMELAFSRKLDKAVAQ